MLKNLKFKFDLFLLGFPYGLLGKVYMVEDNKEGKYTNWDRLRYRLYTGKRL